MNRQEAAEVLRIWRQTIADHGVPDFGEKYKALGLAIEALRTGTWRWVDFWKKDRARVKHGIQCSACGECYDWNDPCVVPSYCPECGAEMERGEVNDRP